MARKGVGAKVKKSESLFPTEISQRRSVLVIGGGIAGIQAALDTAGAGYETVIVERRPSIGGMMAKLDKVFPTLDSSMDILTPKMVELANSDLVRLYTYSQIKEVKDSAGSFKVKIKKYARGIDEKLCTGCGECISKCPTKVLSEFDENLSLRNAIYIPTSNAFPNIPVIDKDNCRYDKCQECLKSCEAKAINFEQKDEEVEEEVGAIIVAIGFQPFNPEVYGEYGFGMYKDVITNVQFERMLASCSPGGKILRPSDGKPARILALISCVGSRDAARDRPYCSKICCMNTAKQAMLVKQYDPDTKVFVFYIDIRATGKGYEEFIRRTQQEYGVNYIRGRVSKVYPKRDKLILKGEDTLLSKKIQLEVDLVVLAVGIEGQKEATNLAQILNIPIDNYGFLNSVHPKLRPVETETRGIYLAGGCQQIMDISEAVTQASAAAVKACNLLAGLTDKE